MGVAGFDEKEFVPKRFSLVCRLMRSFGLESLRFVLSSVLVLSAAGARNRTRFHRSRFDYEHEHHAIEHEHVWWVS